ncbi:MAG TPA: hypothetical protein VFG47_03005 [Geminicoccaceae bacterium]|nr:hypothetical protein [Geminicoccaceae bacterium]
MALSGDTTALRLCLERLLPPCRERPVRFALPAITTAADAAGAVAALARAVAAGELTPGEAAELGRQLAAFANAREAAELERRLSDLEARVGEAEP